MTWRTLLSLLLLTVYYYLFLLPHYFHAIYVFCTCLYFYLYISTYYSIFWLLFNLPWQRLHLLHGKRKRKKGKGQDKKKENGRYSVGGTVGLGSLRACASGDGGYAWLGWMVVPRCPAGTTFNTAADGVTTRRSARHFSPPLRLLRPRRPHPRAFPHYHENPLPPLYSCCLVWFVRFPRSRGVKRRAFCGSPFTLPLHTPQLAPITLCGSCGSDVCCVGGGVGYSGVVTQTPLPLYLPLPTTTDLHAARCLFRLYTPHYLPTILHLDRTWDGLADGW